MLSVIIITKNEGNNLRRCLESVSWADEIIVLDSQSSDNTLEIAREYTQKVYLSEDWQGYGIQKQRALDYASGDWVLNLDADESITNELKTDILQEMKEDKADAYQIPIVMYFYGRSLPHSSSPTRHVRLFKREGAVYSSDRVHEKILLPKNARIAKLKAPINHHSFQDVSHALYKINRYSSYSAKIRRQNKKPINLAMVLGGTGWMFFRCYVLQRGFLDGLSGFLLAIFKAQGTFYRGIKQLYPDLELSTLAANKDNNWHG